MPTIFARRYMRDRPPNRERWIGFVCLAISLGIVGLFVVQARTTRPSFFAVDPEKLAPSVAPEIKHARSLLPESPAPGWSRAEPPEALAAEDAAKSWPADAPRLPTPAPRRVYVGRYLNRLDPRQQLTLRILDLVTPIAAAAAFDALRPADATGEPVGLRGWRSAGGDVGFVAGRYLTLVSAGANASGATLTPSLLAREAADRQVAYAAAPTDTATEGKPAAPRGSAPAALPTPADGAWSAPSEVATYNPANLWEKIDGRAEQYLAFGFAEMVCGTYRLTAGAGAVDCFVYRMTEPENAFGIYRNEQPEHPRPVSIGKEGYQGKGSLFFWKGRSYVQLVIGEGSEVSEAALQGLARALADWIPAAEGNLWAEEAMPKGGMVAGSLTYLGKSALSLDFLDDVFSAEYEVGSGRLTLFAKRCADPAAAAALFEKYAAYMAESGRVIRKSDAAGAQELVGEISGEFDAIIVRGRFFGGATAAPDEASAGQRAKELVEGLKKLPGGG